MQLQTCQNVSFSMRVVRVVETGSHFKEIADGTVRGTKRSKPQRVWHVNLGSDSSKGTIPEACVAQQFWLVTGNKSLHS